MDEKLRVAHASLLSHDLVFNVIVLFLSLRGIFWM